MLFNTMSCVVDPITIKWTLIIFCVDDRKENCDKKILWTGVALTIFALLILDNVKKNYYVKITNSD